MRKHPGCGIVGSIKEPVQYKRRTVTTLRRGTAKSVYLPGQTEFQVSTTRIHSHEDHFGFLHGLPDLPRHPGPIRIS